MPESETKWPGPVAWLGAAAGYWLCGKASLMLALPTGYSAPIWPAAGIALVAVLTYGWRIVPALLIGSFAVNAGISFDTSGPAAIVRSAALALWHSSGQVGQAVFGAALIRRFVGWPSALGRPREIIAFVLLAGPIACVVSPTVGNATLYSLGIVSRTALPISWLTWWVGDVIGAVLVAPLLLSFVGKPADVWRRRRLSVSCPVAIAVVVFGAGYVLAGMAEADRLRQGFDRETETRTKLLEESLGRSVEALRSLRGLFRGSDKVLREEFAAASAELFRDKAGLQALEWLPRVSAAERKAFEAEHRLAIFERSPAGDVVPRSPAADYYPVLFAEPAAGNERVLGFDPASDKQREAVMLLAAANGEAVASEPIELVQGKDSRPGVVIFLPFYGGGGDPKTREERIARCAGFLVAVYRTADFVAASIDNVAGARIPLSIRDTETGLPVYGSATDEPLDRAALSIGLERRQTVRLPGRTWNARFWATSEFIAERRSIAPWAVLAGGLILSSLLGAFLLRETGHSAEVEAVVVERTAALQQANVELEALSMLDSLTQIANRRSLDAALAREWDRGRRERTPLSLLMCDIDFFKKFNDTKGHPAGDEALRRVARAIRAAAKRPADFTGRYGGEEFLVLLPNTTAEGAIGVAEDIRRHVSALGIENPGSPSRRLTISIGVATTTPTGDAEVASLVQRADRAVYRAKHEGRDRVEVEEKQADAGGGT